MFDTYWVMYNVKQRREGKQSIYSLMEHVAGYIPEENVIMDVNPEKLDKKDNIFMNLFQAYGKNFIDVDREGKNKP